MSFSIGPKALRRPWLRLLIASRIFGSQSGEVLAWTSAPAAGAIRAASELPVAVRLAPSDEAPETSADTPEKVGTAAWYSSGPLLLLHAAARNRPVTRNDWRTSFMTPSFVDCVE